LGRVKHEKMAASTSGFLAKAFEKYFFEYSLYDKVRESGMGAECCLGLGVKASA
jgi:hypothetical protein